MGRIENKPKDDVPVMHGTKGNNLTIKQRRFVKSVVATGNGTQAVIDAGYKAKNRGTAGAMSSELLQLPKIQNAIAEEMDRAGLNNSTIFEAMTEAMASGLGRDSRNSDAIRVMDMYHKLVGNYAPKQIEKKEFSLQLQAKEDTELKKLIQEQSEKLAKLTEKLS